MTDGRMICLGNNSWRNHATNFTLSSFQIHHWEWWTILLTLTFNTPMSRFIMFSCDPPKIIMQWPLTDIMIGENCNALVLMRKCLRCRYMRYRGCYKRHTLAMTTPSYELPQEVQQKLASNPIRPGRMPMLGGRERSASMLEFILWVSLKNYKMWYIDC